MVWNIARTAVGAAALAMGLIEIAAVFVESAYALILAGLFILGAFWLWVSRDSIWPILAIAMLLVLELVYLSDYDWGDTVDRTMIILTVSVCSLGLIAVIAALVASRSRPAG